MRRACRSTGRIRAALPDGDETANLALNSS
jgi:hypothetical protein